MTPAKPITTVTATLAAFAVAAIGACDPNTSHGDAVGTEARSTNPNPGITAVCPPYRIYFDGQCRTAGWFGNNLGSTGFQTVAVIGGVAAQGLGSTTVADHGVMLLEQSPLGEISKMSIIRPNRSVAYEHAAAVSRGGDAFPQYYGYGVQQYCDDPTTVTLESGTTIEVSGQCYDDTVAWFGRDWDVGGGSTEVGAHLVGHVDAGAEAVSGDFCTWMGDESLEEIEDWCLAHADAADEAVEWLEDGAALVAADALLGFRAFEAAAGGGYTNTTFAAFDYGVPCSKLHTEQEQYVADLCQAAVDGPPALDPEDTELVITDIDPEEYGGCDFEVVAVTSYPCTVDVFALRCPGTCTQTLPAPDYCNLSAAGSTSIDFELSDEPCTPI